MKTAFNIIIILTLLTSVSCNNDDSVLEPNSKSVTDCYLSDVEDDSDYFIGICVDGTNSALPNETITFASKATPNFDEIIWSVESGNMEIINIENSIENNVEIGRLKTIATVKFNSDFSGDGILRADAVNDSGENAGMRHYIEMENNQ